MTPTDLWNCIIEHWRQQDIPILAGASLEAITNFEKTHSVVLPADVRDYFMIIGGTGHHLDDDLYHFWSLEEAKPVHEELADNGEFKNFNRFAYRNYFMFVDYSICLCYFAVKLTGDPTQPAPVICIWASDSLGDQKASSFREFMTLYADDPNNLL